LFKGTVYRGVKGQLTKISTQYVIGNDITWITVTSTSKNSRVKDLFSGDNNATWMMIQVTDGRDISSLSLFPSEEEVLLPPNTRVRVKEIVGVDVKKFLGLPENVDAIILEQL